MVVVDSHAHLDLMYEKLKSGPGSAANIYQKLAEESPAKLKIVFSMSKPSNWSSRDKFIERGVSFTYGLHPSFASNHYPQEVKDALRHWAAHEDVVGIGEFGLDYSYNEYEPYHQEQMFIAQVTVALELKKPFVLHLRNAKRGRYLGSEGDAYRAALDLLRRYVPYNYVFVVHCWSADLETARDFNYYFENVYFSFSPMLILSPYLNLDEVVRRLPLVSVYTIFFKKKMTLSPLVSRSTESTYGRD